MGPSVCLARRDWLSWQMGLVDYQEKGAGCGNGDWILVERGLVSQKGLGDFEKKGLSMGDGGC